MSGLFEEEKLLSPSPYNAYKNSKNIDNELGYYPLLSTKTPKIDTQKYVFQGSPPIMPIKTPKT